MLVAAVGKPKIVLLTRRTITTVVPLPRDSPTPGMGMRWVGHPGSDGRQLPVTTSEMIYSCSRLGAMTFLSQAGFVRGQSPQNREARKPIPESTWQ